MDANIEPLNPVAISIGPVPIHWYGLIIGIGIVLGFFIATRESEKLGISKDTFADLLLWAIPIAILCARAYYVIFEWEDFYRHNPGEIIKIWNGGLAIHGGLIGAIGTGIVFAKIKKISFWKLADIAAPSIILGQAIGRWGNFINQEAHGEEVSRQFLENLHLPEFIVNQMYINGAYYHPTFLYESIWNIIGFAILILLRRVNLRRGELFLTYIIWYSIGRFFIEGMRTDSLIIGEQLRAAQTISVLLIISAVLVLFVRRTRKYGNERYLD